MGVSRVARAFLVYMLPPLPRCSSWIYPSLISPSRISLPRFHYRVGLHIVLFEVCSAFTHVAACTLARSPIRDRYPGASDISSPPCLLRLLPAGANRRVGLAPTGKRRLVTAHVVSGPSTRHIKVTGGAGPRRQKLSSTTGMWHGRCRLGTPCSTYW